MPTPAVKKDDALPVVALVGRVNVGKSTLFNTLTEQQKAIVSKTPGTTRTSNEGVITWRGKQCRLIDTGGLTFEESVPLEEDILHQSELALEQADAIVFVTDAQDGILPQEKELAKRLRKIKEKKVLLVANKADSPRQEMNLTTGEWDALACGEPIPISATNGRGTGDFLDTLFSLLHKQSRRPKKAAKEKVESINIALVGKPNVGKSSLFNKLIGEDRVIVSETPHTTREPHDTLVTYDDPKTKKKYTITFIDTAGIRRKAKVKGILEKLGIHKSIQTAEKADIILFVIDAMEPISAQDKQLAALMEKKAKSVILIVNKWDMTDDTSDANRREVKERVYAHFPNLDFAPAIFVSAKTGFRIHQIFPEIVHAWHARHTSIPVSALEHFLKHAMEKHAPARGKGTRHPKLLGMRQINTAPPIFELFVKYRTSLHRSYLHFLQNKLREQFDFFATPIVIKLTKMKR